jgi:predicted DNA-binding helix-hairpin-helix protein
MDVQRKLEILADAAKYDASCASSGTEQRDSSDGKGLGSTARHGHPASLVQRFKPKAAQLGFGF